MAPIRDVPLTAELPVAPPGSMAPALKLVELEADARYEPGTGPRVLGPARLTTSPRDRRALRALTLADLTAGTLAVALASPLADGGGALGLAVLWLALVCALRTVGGARERMVLHPAALDELPAVLRATTVAAAAVVLLAPSADPAKGLVITAWALVLLLAPLTRTVARRVARGSTRERVLVLGSGQIAGLLAAKVANHPELGLDVVGCLDAGLEDDAVPGALPLTRLGRLDELEAVAAAHDVHRVVIAFSAVPHEAMLDAIRRSKRLGLKIAVVPRLFEVIGGRAELDDVEGLTVLALRPVGRTRAALARKRALDVVVSAVALALLAPLFAVLALVVRLGSPGPVLFRQPRVGRGQQQFDMLKLRTMVVGAEALRADLDDRNEMVGGKMFKLRDDPRIVRGAGFLRRTSLDELPQLVNVLRGEMSLVGPRPLIPSEDAEILGWHRARLDITPGLTGPWQVMGRNAIAFEEMVKLDYLYVADWSLWHDVKLMLRTVPVVLRRSGA